MGAALVGTGQALVSIGNGLKKQWYLEIDRDVQPELKRWIDLTNEAILPTVLPVLKTVATAAVAIAATGATSKAVQSVANIFTHEQKFEVSDKRDTKKDDGSGGASNGLSSRDASSRDPSSRDASSSDPSLRETSSRDPSRTKN